MGKESTEIIRRRGYWRIQHADPAPLEHTHQQRVWKILLVATTAAQENTALKQALSALMTAASLVQQVGFKMLQGKPAAFFAKKSLDKARVTMALATPDAALYLQDHL